MCAYAGKAIIGSYDIFGYFPQTLQGADILAETYVFVTSF